MLYNFEILSTLRMVTLVIAIFFLLQSIGYFAIHTVVAVLAIGLIFLFLWSSYKKIVKSD